MCSETKPPSSEPTPSPARMTVHASGPPSDRFEITAPSTTKTDPIMFPSDAATTITHTHVRDENSRQPSRRSARNDCGSSFDVRGQAQLREEERAGSEARRVDRERPARADRVTTTPPPIAVPTMPADAIERPRSAFACCSRPGLIVIGVRPVDAGLKNARGGARERLQDDELPDVRRVGQHEQRDRSLRRHARRRRRSASPPCAAAGRRRRRRRAGRQRAGSPWRRRRSRDRSPSRSGRARRTRARST